MTMVPKWSVCPSCFRYLTDGIPHFCPGPQPQIYTWPQTTDTTDVLIKSAAKAFDPEKEVPGTVILMDGTYYMKLALTEEVHDPYDWYSDEGMALNATIMNARFKEAKTFEFLKRPRTSKRAVLKRFLDHKDIDQALEELKDVIDSEDN